MSAWRPLFRRLSPPGARGRLTILIFHRVLPAPDPMFPDVPDVRHFDEILRWLGSWLNVIPLDAASRALAAGSLPERAAAITFDDGYADNFIHAMPRLRAHGMSATFFVVTGALDGGRMWNDTIIEAIRCCRDAELDLSDVGLGRHALTSAEARRAASEAVIDSLKYRVASDRLATAERVAELAKVAPPNDLMMTTEQVKSMRRAGMQIGAHTVSHPILARLSRPDARREMADSKTCLEEILGEKVSLFAYPNGKPGEDFGDDHTALAREIGFDAAFTTAPSAARPGCDLMRLPRFTPWDKSRLRFGARLALNLRRA
jgi:peptidoglycan/xylan/chitin deacetylase (PgdA/CDA1 family)